MLVIDAAIARHSSDWQMLFPKSFAAQPYLTGFQTKRAATELWNNRHKVELLVALLLWPFTIALVRERQQVVPGGSDSWQTEEPPAEGGVSMGSSEDLASLLHTAGYECHHRLRLCTAMHPVSKLSESPGCAGNAEVHHTGECQMSSKGMSLTATALANKIFCDVTGCHMYPGFAWDQVVCTACQGGL